MINGAVASFIPFIYKGRFSTSRYGSINPDICSPELIAFPELVLSTKTTLVTAKLTPECHSLINIDSRFNRCLATGGCKILMPQISAHPVDFRLLSNAFALTTLRV